MTTTNKKNRSGRRTAVTRIGAALLLAAGLALGGAAGAQALPPDGPGPETPGTSSRVWPTTVKSGDKLNFEVSGYPANETVYIKIDDGTMCTDTSHGACVYATQKLDGNGYASGSIVVPNLAEGAHWLRMLATGDVFDSQTGQKLGYEGYTRRGGNDFTVVAGGSGGPTIGDKGTAAAPGGGSANSDGTIAGGSVSLNVEDEATPSPTATAGSMDDITTNVAQDGDSSAARNVPANYAAQQPAGDSGIPVLGIGVLAGAVVLGGGALTWALVRQRRLAKAAGTPHDLE